VNINYITINVGIYKYLWTNVKLLWNLNNFNYYIILWALSRFYHLIEIITDRHKDFVSLLVVDNNFHNRLDINFNGFKFYIPIVLVLLYVFSKSMINILKYYSFNSQTMYSSLLGWFCSYTFKKTTTQMLINNWYIPRCLKSINVVEIYDYGPFNINHKIQLC